MPSPQQPIGSGFSAASTTAHVIRGVDLVGKVAIVTGGHSGLGLETTRALSLAGARVIVPVRDIAKARRAVDGIGNVELDELDLNDPASIDSFAGRFVRTGLPLDILVNSAGIMALPERQLDARGYEMQFSTNHLGHFRLTARLWPALTRTGGARVVSVSSRGHYFSPVVFDDLHFERRDYEPWSAYGQSKTANILFALELDRRGEAHGVRAFSLHPGGIAGTALSQHLPVEVLQKGGVLDANGEPIIDPSKDLKSPMQGAATQVWCATSPLLAGMGGVYCSDSDIVRVVKDDSPFSIESNHSDKRERGVQSYAVDPQSAERLWAVSEQLTGVSFGM
ncbi:oxidoreductase [Pseudomonas sp. R2.Fl]|nr:oxidoreductase [Pseudomonas sp. R2.Fl]